MPFPVSTTSPANSCPNTILLFAKGTKPFMICKSLVQIEDILTSTITSRLSVIFG